MRQRLYPLLSLFVLMTGCDSGVTRLGQVADSTRAAAEHVAFETDAVNDAREAKIYADAQGMEDREKAQAILENGGRPRYEIRQDGPGDSWAVYDTYNNRVARVGPKSQAGLTHADAEATFKSLLQDDRANPSADAGDPQLARSR